MERTAVAERHLELIARISRVHDPALLEELERVLDEHQRHPELIPLQDAEVEAILRNLLTVD